MLSRKELVEHLKNETRVLKDRRVEKAFEKVDRADFVDENCKVEAYEDYPLPIGEGQTISQPTTVAFMLEKLGVKEGDKVLDLGSGSGWTTALLAEMVGEKGRVFGVELVPELVKFGQKNLAKYDLKNAKIVQAGEELGLSSEAPFDRILVSAAAQEMPEALLGQLKVGGVMVIPVRGSIVRIEKLDEPKAGKPAKVEKKEFPGFVFVPLIS